MAKTKILITGAGGFIFSNFVRHMLHFHADKYNIVSVDKITNPKNLHNIYANKNHTFYIGDVVDAHFINNVFELERPDIVIHAAAEASVQDSISNAVLFITSNILGTQVMIDACVKFSVNKLVLISSDEVYGQLENNDLPWKEDAPLNPRNPYSATKAAGECLVKAAANTHGLKYSIIRMCNNFGPRQSDKALVPKIVKCILNNEKLSMHGDGSDLREWIYVDDSCSAIFKIIEDQKDNEIYNVSSGYEFSNLEVFFKVCNAMETGNDLITFVKDWRPGNDKRYSIDTTKIKALGWAPEFKFKDALKYTCQWYTKNKWIFNK
jgi:dTDP-glucose 4,6-dehydratase